MLAASSSLGSELVSDEDAVVGVSTRGFFKMDLVGYPTEGRFDPPPRPLLALLSSSLEELWRVIINGLRKEGNSGEGLPL